jgi:predicted amidohydrolase
VAPSEVKYAATILIKGGRVIDPASGVDRLADEIIQGKKIAGLRESRVA